VSARRIAASASASAVGRRAPKDMKRPNIVFIAIDTLRADHLGCYGYHRDTSPEIDGLAERGATFLSALAGAIPTQPSFTTMLTGVHPLRHQIVSHQRAPEVQLSPEIPTIAEILSGGMGSEKAPG